MHVSTWPAMLVEGEQMAKVNAVEMDNVFPYLSLRYGQTTMGMQQTIRMVQIQMILLRGMVIAYLVVNVMRVGKVSKQAFQHFVIHKLLLFPYGLRLTK